MNCQFLKLLILAAGCGMSLSTAAHANELQRETPPRPVQSVVIIQRSQPNLKVQPSKVSEEGLNASRSMNELSTAQQMHFNQVKTAIADEKAVLETIQGFH